VFGNNYHVYLKKRNSCIFAQFERLKPSDGNPKITQQKGWNYSLLKFHGGPVNKPYLIKMGKYPLKVCRPETQHFIYPNFYFEPQCQILSSIWFLLVLFSAHASEKILDGNCSWLWYEGYRNI
jgi:hypothetical protein